MAVHLFFVCTSPQLIPGVAFTRFRFTTAFLIVVIQISAQQRFDFLFACGKDGATVYIDIMHLIYIMHLTVRTSTLCNDELEAL